MLTEVLDRGRKLHCEPGREVVSHTILPHLVKVKINFDDAEKLTWKKNKIFTWFNKNYNLKSHFRTSKNAT